jgi:hypothetical protein
LLLIAALVAPGKVWTRSGPVLGRGGGRAVVGARKALPDRVGRGASRPIRLDSLAGGALADFAFPDDGFGAHGAFLAFCADVAGNAESGDPPWPCRRRGFWRRLSEDWALGEQFRSLTAKP